MGGARYCALHRVAGFSGDKSREKPPWSFAAQATQRRLRCTLTLWGVKRGTVDGSECVPSRPHDGHDRRRGLLGHGLELQRVAEPSGDRLPRRVLGGLDPLTHKFSTGLGRQRRGGRKPTPPDPYAGSTSCETTGQVAQMIVKRLAKSMVPKKTGEKQTINADKMILFARRCVSLQLAEGH